MNNQKNSVKRAHYFITALLTAMLFGNTTPVVAQETSPIADRCSAFGLTAMPKGYVGLGTNYWNYLSQDDGSLSQYTLSFTTDEPRILLESGTTIQTRIPKTILPNNIAEHDALNEYMNLFLKTDESALSDSFFYTVKVKDIKPNRYLPALGHTLELTGFAYVTDVQEDNSQTEHVATLRVGMLTSELSKDDRLIPHHCYFNNDISKPHNTPTAATAKITALLGDAYLIQGIDRSNMVLLDKGANDGLAIDQKGMLIENTLSPQAKRKSAAQVKIVRVYSNRSIAAVTDAVAEITKGQTIELTDQFVNNINTKP